MSSGSTEYCLGLVHTGDHALSSEEISELRELHHSSRRRRRNATVAFIGNYVLFAVFIWLTGGSGLIFEPVAVVWAILSTAIAPAVAFLFIRDQNRILKALSADLADGGKRRFEGAAETLQRHVGYLEGFRTLLVAPIPDSGEASVEILAGSGRLWRLNGHPVAFHYAVDPQEVAHAPAHAAMAADYLEPLVEDEYGTLETGGRELSAGEREELRKLARQHIRRRWVAPLGFSLWFGWGLTSVILGIYEPRFPIQLLFLGFAAVVLDAGYVSRLVRYRRIMRDAELGAVMIFRVTGREGSEAEGSRTGQLLEVLSVSQLPWTEDGVPSDWRQVREK